MRRSRVAPSSWLTSTADLCPSSRRRDSRPVSVSPSWPDLAQDRFGQGVAIAAQIQRRLLGVAQLGGRTFQSHPGQQQLGHQIAQAIQLLGGSGGCRLAFVGRRRPRRCVVGVVAVALATGAAAGAGVVSRGLRGSGLWGLRRVSGSAASSARKPATSALSVSGRALDHGGGHVQTAHHQVADPGLGGHGRSHRRRTRSSSRCTSWCTDLKPVNPASPFRVWISRRNVGPGSLPASVPPVRLFELDPAQVQPIQALLGHRPEGLQPSRAAWRPDRPPSAPRRRPGPGPASVAARTRICGRCRAGGRDDGRADSPGRGAGTSRGRPSPPGGWR